MRMVCSGCRTSWRVHMKYGASYAPAVQSTSNKYEVTGSRPIVRRNSNCAVIQKIKWSSLPTSCRPHPVPVEHLATLGLFDCSGSQNRSHRTNVRNAAMRQSNYRLWRMHTRQNDAVEVKGSQRYKMQAKASRQTKVCRQRRLRSESGIRRTLIVSARHRSCSRVDLSRI